jgi:hypothetical protein
MRWLWLLVLALVLVPATAWGQATSTTVHFQGTDPPAPSSDCNGNPYTLVIGPYSGVMHETDLPNGTFHITLTAQGSETLTPDAPGLPTYTGHFAFWDGDNLNQRNATSTTTFPNQLKGSDGSHITAVNTTHFSISANGTAVVDFSNFKCIQHG